MLYASAIGRYERATALVEQVIDAVQSGSDFECHSVTLSTVCSEIAQFQARILQTIQRLPVGSEPAGPRLLAAADRHLTALGKLCNRVRVAEQAAAHSLRLVAPRLDKSIQGRAMVSAYSRNRAQ
jgi:hypothetical protein